MATIIGLGVAMAVYVGAEIRLEDYLEEKKNK